MVGARWRADCQPRNEIKSPARLRPRPRLRSLCLIVSNNLAAGVSAHFWQLDRCLSRGSRNFYGRPGTWKRPLAFYTQLEFLIATGAALTPALFWLIRAVYIASGGILAMGAFVGTCGDLDWKRVNEQRIAMSVGYDVTM